MSLLVSVINASIISSLELSNIMISFVEQFPRRIQMTFGGNPRKVTRSLKSLSLVTIANPSFLANSQTRESEAYSRLSSCKCFDPTNVPAKKSAGLGDKF